MEGTSLDNELSDDVQTEGFDLQAGKSWIYPTNYQMREYQYRIVQEALYQNTMVSLPTGLGKTFIAAVVMFNFYRWYPSGKVIFLAPTRPLVKQQIDACYDIMAIPQNVTAELTGSKIQSSREEIWKSKRVFFVTPQVLQNDLDTFPDLGKRIKCLVFDEAHKAKGNHAYCEVIRKMVVRSKYFRVLALSATPGSSVNDVIDLAKSLLIAHLEVRTEDSPDVAPYVFHRTLETVVVPLGGKLEEIKTKYLQILERYVRVLKDHRVIMGNCANLTKGKIFMTLKDFTNRHKHNKLPNHGEIVKTLNICITLYHGFELLIRHGLRGFLNFFEEHSDKALLRSNTQIFNIMAEVQNYLGPRPDIELLPDGTIPEIPHNSKFGHPKFYKLRQIMVDYYNDPENATRKVIIFSEFKETVLEAYAMLMQHTPLIKPKYFMGQGAITQKQQINIIKSFKEGSCNTLISTCIGEEGLDIGEVDLIICFDISNKSPIRLVQRMGRTGRKKQGKVIIMVTIGKEQELLKDCIANKQYLSDHILKSKEITKNMYSDNPRMIPTSIFPSCQKIHITVPKPIVKTKSGNLKDLFNKLAQSEPTISQVLNDVEVVENEDRIPETIMYWNKCDPFQDGCTTIQVNYSKRLEVLRNSQTTERIGHSKDTEILSSLLQFADAKRYNLPITQLPALTLAKPKGRTFGRTESSDNLKQTDIRNLFFKPRSVPEVIQEENIPLIVIEENLKKQKLDRIINNIQSEISTYMAVCYTEMTHCNFCERTSLCNRLKKPNLVDLKISQWVQPNIGVIDTLTADDFDSFLVGLTAKENTNLLDDNDFDALNNMMEVDEESFVFNEIPKKDETFSFKAPDSIKKVFDRCNISVSADEFEESIREGYMSHIICNEKENLIESKENTSNNKKLDYSDFVDTSLFGLSSNDISENEIRLNEESAVTKTNILDSHFDRNMSCEVLNDERSDLCTKQESIKKLNYSDLFDDSIFGLSKLDTSLIENLNNTESPVIGSKTIDRNLSMGYEDQIIEILESPVISSGTLNRQTVVDQNMDITDSPVLSSGITMNHKTVSDIKFPALKDFDEITIQYRETLDFFKLGDLNDLFEHDHLLPNSSLLSPDIFAESPVFHRTATPEKESSLPILRANTNNTRLRAARKLFTENQSLDETFVDFDLDNKIVDSPKFPKPCLANLNVVKNGSFYTSKRQVNNSENLQKEEIVHQVETFESEQQPQVNKTYKELVTNLQDVCDLSIFGMSQNADTKKDEGETNTCEDSDSTCVNTDELNACHRSDNSEDLFDSPPTIPNKKLSCAIDDFCDISSLGFSQEFYSKTQDEGRRREKIKDTCPMRENFPEKANASQNRTERASKLSQNKKQIGIDHTKNGKVASEVEKNTNKMLTKSVEMISNNEKIVEKIASNSTLLSEFCDMSIFGLDITSEPEHSKTDDKSSPILSQRFNEKAEILQKTPAKHRTNNDDLSPIISQGWNRKPELSKSPVLSQRFRQKPQLRQLRLRRKESVPSTTIGKDDLSIFQTRFSDDQNKNSNGIGNPDSNNLYVGDLSVFQTNSSQKENQKANDSNLELEDVFDLSIFGLANQKVPENTANKRKSISSIVDKYLTDEEQHGNITPLKSSVTVTQVMNLMNKSVDKSTCQNTNNRLTTKQNDETFSYLLDDDNIFMEDMPMPSKKTPLKNTSLRQSRTPSTKKPLTGQRPSTSRSLHSTSDDEFEESPFKHQGWIRTRKRLQLNDTERELKKPKIVSNNVSKKLSQRKKRKRGAANPYIEDEAALSSDEYATDDTQSDGGSSQDVLEMSFVDDDTLDIGNNTTMHAKYLQSVRSPVKRGLFKIPERPSRNIVDVFSQVETYNDENTYLDDSFCVDVDDCDLTQDHDLSELEIAEMRLEDQRKRKNKEKNVVNYKKRRRVMVISSSDSE